MSTLVKALIIAAIFGGGWAGVYLVAKVLF